MNKHYEIWCDGSYRQAHHSIGAAWVCVTPDGREQEKSIPLPRLLDTHAHGSDIAEITAFKDALAQVPDAAQVIVHMDCKNVIAWLSGEAITTKSKRQEPRICRIFAEAIAQKARMESVEIVYTADKTSPNMRRAHNLSSAASSPHAKVI
jgi:ribonuclease HI